MLSWFASKNGRIFTRITVGVISAATFAIPLAAHGPFVYKYQELIQMYEECEPKPLSPYMVSMTKQVVKECDIKEKEKENIKFFRAVGDEAYHAGGRNSPWGAVIGVPLTFEEKGEFNITNLKVFYHDIDWILDGYDLLDALTFPEEAQKFAVAKEIYASDIMNVVERASLAAFCILIPARYAQAMNIKRNAFRLPIRNRCMFYFFCYSVAFAFYKIISFLRHYQFELECDKKVAEIGINYLEGGIKFYEKSLEKNKEVRKLLTGRGINIFTEEGDFKCSWIFPCLQLQTRIKKLKDIQKENATEPK